MVYIKAVLLVVTLTCVCCVQSTGTQVMQFLKFGHTGPDASPLTVKLDLFSFSKSSLTF